MNNAKVLYDNTKFCEGLLRTLFVTNLKSFILGQRFKTMKSSQIFPSFSP